MTFLEEAFSELNSLRKNIVATCKYVSDDDAVVDGLFRDHLIRFSQPSVLNDPVEVNPGIRLSFGSEPENYAHYTYQGIRLPSYREQIYLNLIEARYNRYGILSLSKNVLSYDMWNRYANEHRGFIIDFKQNIDEKASFKSEGLFSGMVRYLQEYEIVVDRPVGPNGYATYDYLNQELFLSKTYHWRDEQEYRIVRPLAEHPEYKQPIEHKLYRDRRMYLFEYDPSAIAMIVFGAAMEPVKKSKIMDLTAGLNIVYLQALLDKDHFEMYYLPITLWKSADQFLSQLPQVFVTDDWEFKYKDLEKTIRNLEELPYTKDKIMLQMTLDYIRRKEEKKRAWL